MTLNTTDAEGIRTPHPAQIDLRFASAGELMGASRRLVVHLHWMAIPSSSLGRDGIKPM
jgi:hypothetical protein